MKSTHMKGLKLGKFSFVQSSSGLVVSKERNPYHFTIAFNNLKNCLDIHLKNEKRNEYETIFNCSYEFLSKFADEYSKKSVLFFQKSLKLVRPGWLRRHKYYVHYKSENEFIDAFKEHSLSIKSKIPAYVLKVPCPAGQLKR